MRKLFTLQFISIDAPKFYFVIKIFRKKSQLIRKVFPQTKFPSNLHIKIWRSIKLIFKIFMQSLRSPLIFLLTSSNFTVSFILSFSVYDLLFYFIPIIQLVIMMEKPIACNLYLKKSKIDDKRLTRIKINNWKTF